MNTRRKLVQPKAAAPSVRWHLINEAYAGIFLAEARAHVEAWYNLGATGPQRELFRSICAEVFAQDGSAAPPAYKTAYTATTEANEADLLVKYYTKVLTAEGKRKVRAWVLHQSNSRRRANFRDVFTGCQTVIEKESVMHKDYAPPETESYATDRTHFNRSVDWTSLRARSTAQRLQAQRVSPGEDANPPVAPSSSSRAVGPSSAATATAAAAEPPQRFVKPKNQFDGVNSLAALGYDDSVPASEAAADLRAKQKAFADASTYYVDADGSTVFVARGNKTARPDARSTEGGGILSSVTSDPIAQWKVKTCDY